MMKTFRLFSMAALALTMAACSNNDDNEIASSPAQPAEAGVVHFTATLPAPGSGATTRTTMTEGTGTDEGKLLVAWKAGDEIALCHNGTKDVVTLTADDINTDGSVTISTVITATDNDDVTVVYPAASVTSVAGATPTYAKTTLTAQEGTRDYIAANLDKRVGTGNIAVSGDKASFKSNISMSTPEIAVWKLTLANPAKQLCVLGGDKAPIAGATLATQGTEFTIAVPAVSSQNVTIVAADESNNCYYLSKDGVSLVAGSYYQSAPTMTTLGTSSTGADVYKLPNSESTIPADKTVVLCGASRSRTDCSGNATLILMGDNTLVGSSYCGLKAGGPGTTLTITGIGSLTATGARNRAGIGSNESGEIVILGGTITATGGNEAAGIGIGNGDSGFCGNITISGGKVTATGGSLAAGIGSGCRGFCSTITISGGTVTATGGDDAAGIGSGCEGTCGKITINGGTIMATGFHAAGIGSGWLGSCGNITISGGDITATGGDAAAGIGGGFENKACGTITITSGVTSVTATKGISAPNSIGKGVNGEDITVNIEAGANVTQN